jgi:hypothetical protein
MKSLHLLIIGLFIAVGCIMSKPVPEPQNRLIAKGRQLFFNETFGGNGRTCGTCHPAENNFTIDPTFITALPDSNPLFVSEFNPNLKDNFENARLVRAFGMITENLDGFDDVKNKFTLRGVPHTLGLRFSVASRNGPHTGWSGDGAPGDRSLRAFATGAVVQHFTKTLNRIPGVDFRLPTEDELDALNTFMLSLGPQEELKLPLPLKDPVALRGQALFNDRNTGKCFICHFNAGANANPDIFGAGAGNLNFNTGVEDLPDQPSSLVGAFKPRDDGFGTPGDSTFNVPPLVEAAATGPFFHNNAVQTIEAAVAFYDGGSFNSSPARKLLDSLTGGNGIELDATQIVAIAAFLRVINALENIREDSVFLNEFAERKFLGNVEFNQLPEQSGQQVNVAVQVLSGGGLHPAAVAHLKKAAAAIEELIKHHGGEHSNVKKALTELSFARKELTQ